MIIFSLNNFTFTEIGKREYIHVEVRQENSSTFLPMRISCCQLLGIVVMTFFP